MDYAFALFVLLIFWWVLLAVWVAVRLHSPGPGIFRQLRVGQDQTTYTCYKFRTMDVSAPSLGTHEVSASMVTPLGAWLRKTKLDELPQIVNILLNQMSLIGPRPCLPLQENLIRERQLAGVFKVKPGITGLAQVKGIDMSEPVRLARMDQQYIRTRGLLLDAKIALATALGRGSGDRVNGS
nr:sugar transferase [Pseudomonas sp.]